MKENKHDELEESEPCGIKEKLKQWYDEQEFATLDDIKLALTHARIGLRWMLLSIIIGLLVGAFSSFFAWSLQMGGSLGNSIGRLFRQKKYNRKILVMSGMSAAFSAVFGTPLAASVFPMEMVNVGGHAVFCPGALRVCCYRGKPVRD